MIRVIQFKLFTCYMQFFTESLFNYVEEVWMTIISNFMF